MTKGKRKKNKNWGARGGRRRFDFGGEVRRGRGKRASGGGNFAGDGGKGGGGKRGRERGGGPFFCGKTPNPQDNKKWGVRPRFFPPKFFFGLSPGNRSRSSGTGRTNEGVAGPDVPGKKKGRGDTHRKGPKTPGGGETAGAEGGEIEDPTGRVFFKPGAYNRREGFSPRPIQFFVYVEKRGKFSWSPDWEKGGGGTERGGGGWGR